MLNIIKNTEVAPNDILLVYFSGHGAVTGRSMDQVLYPCVGPEIYREELDNSILDKNAKFKILITDACSVSLEGFSVPPPKFKSSGNYAIDNLKILLSYEGYLSITAASQGEVAFGPDTGGFFTSSLVKDVLLSNPPNNWQDVIDETTNIVNSLYRELPGYLRAENRELYGQTNQNPQIYSLPSLNEDFDFVITEDDYIPEINEYIEEKPDSSGSGGLSDSGIHSDNSTDDNDYTDSSDLTNSTNINPEGNKPQGLNGLGNRKNDKYDSSPQGSGWLGKDLYGDDYKEYSDEEYDNWEYYEEDDYLSELDNLSDEQWDILFVEFSKSLDSNHVNIDKLSEREITNLFYEFLVEYVMHSYY